MSKKYQERLARSSGFSSKQFKSDFGLKVLKKFGWEEGKGLGKNEDGRAECIQQQRRDGNAGLGSATKSGPESQWDNWWSDVFNTTAKRILEKAAASEGRPRAKGWDFEDPESSDSEDDDQPAGGRVTAIKSASRMAGKLRRVVRQEHGPQAVLTKELTSVPTLSTSTKKRSAEDDSGAGAEEACGAQKKRRKLDMEATSSDDEIRAEKRKRKKAEKRIVEEETDLRESPELA